MFKRFLIGGLFLVALSGMIGAPGSWYYFGWKRAEQALQDQQVLDNAKTEGVPKAEPLQKFGMYGDGYGMANSLISAIAVFGALAALLLQWWEKHSTDKHHREQSDMALLAALIAGQASLVDAGSADVALHTQLLNEDNNDPKHAEYRDIAIQQRMRALNELHHLIGVAKSKLTRIPNLNQNE